jgi:hypothetical protein
MGHSSGTHVPSQARERPWQIHPVWRGLGCVMMLIIPIMSYAAASILIDLNFDQGWGFPVPREMASTQIIDIPIPIPGVPSIYWEVEHLLGNLLLGFVLMLVGFGLLMVFYAVLYRVMAPPLRGPLDADPMRRKPRQKKKDWRDRDVTYRH